MGRVQLTKVDSFIEKQNIIFRNFETFFKQYRKILYFAKGYAEATHLGLHIPSLFGMMPRLIDLLSLNI